MQKDKNLEILLKEYAFEKPSSAFNNAVMQHIHAAAPTQPAKPLLNVFFLKALVVLFITVVIAVILCLIYLPLQPLPFNLSFILSSNIYNQLFSFIAVFWVVMFINTGWNKKAKYF